MGNRRMGAGRLGVLINHMEASGSKGGRYGAGSDRWHLEEMFEQRPGLNEDLSGSANGNFFSVTNKNFEVLGTNMTTALVTFASASAGITMRTAGSDNDQAILLPHQDTNQTQWATAGKWGTENEVHAEFLIVTHETDNASLRIGLAETAAAGANGIDYAVDDDKVIFQYASDDDQGALTTNANLHAIVSSGGTDYISDLGIALQSRQVYRLGIRIDSDRKAAVFVNGDQYSLTSATTAGGVKTGKGTDKSVALADDTNLIPTVAVMQHADEDKGVTVARIHCSRNPGPADHD